MGGRPTKHQHGVFGKEPKLRTNLAGNAGAKPTDGGKKSMGEADRCLSISKKGFPRKARCNERTPLPSFGRKNRRLSRSNTVR